MVMGEYGLQSDDVALVWKEVYVYSESDPRDIHALTAVEALTLAQQTARGEVRLIAAEYNWGPPISGRFDTDFMHIWAAARVGTGSLFLHGQRTNGDWSIDIPFERAASFTTPDHVDYDFYSLTLGSPQDFPTQFVLRLDRGNGENRYDNNNGENYRIEPYRGPGVSAIRHGAAIFDLGRILPCKLFWAEYSPQRV
jgi:hypothetical protein